RLQRGVRDGGPDRCRDGHLPGGGGRPEAGGARRTADTRGVARGGHGGGAAAAAPEGDDGVDSRDEPAAHHVEPFDRSRSDEAAGDARPWRHGELARPRPDRDARDVLLAPRARTPPRRDVGGRRGPQRNPAGASRRDNRETAPETTQGGGLT